MIEILTPNPIEDGVGEKPPCPHCPGDLAGIRGQAEQPLPLGERPPATPL